MHITKSELSHASSRTLELTAEATEFELATATASRRETRKYERMAWARVCGWMDGWMDGGINVCMKHMLHEYNRAFEHMHSQDTNRQTIEHSGSMQLRLRLPFSLCSRASDQPWARP